jgi:hypothetical protein
MTPVEALRLKPAGRVPDLIANVSPGAPPRPALNGALTVLGGNAWNDGSKISAEAACALVPQQPPVSRTVPSVSPVAVK